ncbi:50S ribosomal protein L9 [Parasulfuritortus cantonensis]|uniref:Large ribosomal subunit protein bL9 n=1 Tax=Parasulfuritortus cantonensis TaxID=2528202 RepID=A0A4R1BIS1_9PROT|nr:50S ribosomal protein L9 [Parasulfuritortus cantonensis]TCJ17107.1 50S ribosomal protein L9 [Parasulfuritortus cantonensis]
MEIILMDKVANLGNLGDIVKVKDGYARNYLIPQGMAKRATAANKAAFEEKKAELEKLAAEKLVAAQARAEKLEGFELTVAQKAGVDGRLFGSVGNTDIADALQAQGFDVNKAEVRLPEGPFKAIGEYEVVLGLHTDVTATIKLTVVAEQ